MYLVVSVVCRYAPDWLRWRGSWCANWTTRCNSARTLAPTPWQIVHCTHVSRSVACFIVFAAEIGALSPAEAGEQPAAVVDACGLQITENLEPARVGRHDWCAFGVREATVEEAYITALAVMSVADRMAVREWRQQVHEEMRAFGINGADWTPPSSGVWTRPCGAIWTFLDRLPTTASDRAVYGTAMVDLGVLQSMPKDGTLKRFFGALKGNSLELKRGSKKLKRAPYILMLACRLIMTEKAKISAALGHRAERETRAATEGLHDLGSMQPVARKELERVQKQLESQKTKTMAAQARAAPIPHHLSPPPSLADS